MHLTKTGQKASVRSDTPCELLIFRSENCHPEGKGANKNRSWRAVLKSKEHQNTAKEKKKSRIINTMAGQKVSVYLRALAHYQSKARTLSGAVSLAVKGNMPCCSWGAAFSMCLFPTLTSSISSLTTSPQTEKSDPCSCQNFQEVRVVPGTWAEAVRTRDAQQVECTATVTRLIFRATERWNTGSSTTKENCS